MAPPPLSSTKQNGDPKKSVSLRKRILLGTVVAPAAIFLTLSLVGIVRNFQIPTGAMKPNLPPGTHLLAEKCSLWFSGPKRGDVVVFTTAHVPNLMRQYERPQYFIMRLIGLPGDTIFISGGVLHLNDEPYFVNSPDGNPLVYSAMGNLKDGATFTVPKDCYFVLGDNSENSLDSRFWGPLPAKSVEYRYWFTYFFDKRVEERRRQREQE